MATTPAIITNSISYTYTGPLATRVLVTPALETPEITDIATPRMVKSKEQLHWTAQLGKTAVSGSGCGTLTPATGISLTNRQIITDTVQIYFEQCNEQWRGTVFGDQFAAGTAYDSDRSGDIQEAINQLIRDNLRQEMFRLFSFADTTSASANYNVGFNGLWPTLLASGGDSIFANTAYNTLSSSTIVAELTKLVNARPAVMKQMPLDRQKIYVTGNVFEAYVQYLTSQAWNESMLRMENGQLRARFYGIDVVPVYAWDQWIAADSATTGTTNVRMLLTMRENHVLGYDVAPGNEGFETWFDPNTRYQKFLTRFQMGYQYILPDFQVITYGTI